MDKISKCILFILGVALILCGTYKGYHNEIQSSATIYGAGIIVLIFSFLSRFKRFKGFGIEGELWEDKQQEAELLIRDTKESINKLNSSVKTIAEISYTSLASIGRLNPVPKSYKFSVSENLDLELKKLELTDEEISQAKQYFNFLITFDLAFKITDKIKSYLSKYRDEVQKKLRDYPSPIKGNDPDHADLINKKKLIYDEIKEVNKLTDIKAQSNLENVYEDIIKFIEESEYFDANSRETIKSELIDEFLDLEEFIKTKRLRRPSVYNKGDEE